MKKEIIIIGLFLMLLGCNSKTTSTPIQQLFIQLDSTATGIDFTNRLTSGKNMNIIDFTYFYNGGGVATADFNNDGLEDIFLVSNQQANELYINQDDFKFKKIGVSAGIAGTSAWNTGVTVADINADGFMDIYVCGVAKFNGLKSKNELFINNGDLTFTEQAAQYGLDFATYATQAVFFDYDQDGDLDCYLLNYALEESENYVPLKKGRVQDELSGDYLLKNTGGKFEDVSEQAGILQSKIGFGLSVAVSDLNNDGWDDIYVSNDFHEDDYFYVNQKDGTFKESGRDYFNHFSRFSMGSDIADMNNDGYFDMINLDMYPKERAIEKMSVGEDPFEIYNYKLTYGYYHQYAKNSLQLNNQGKGFSDIASYAGVAATDWSWSALLADFDNDQIKDLVISNGIPKRPNDLDFIDFVVNYQKRDPSQINLDTYIKEAIAKMPVGSYHDFMFKGSDSLKFTDKSASWGFDKKTVSNGMAYADFDNDGDLDLIMNRLNSPIGIYKNTLSETQQVNYVQITLGGAAKNQNGVGAKVKVFSNGTVQRQELFHTRGFQSAMGNKLHFGLKDRNVDSVQVQWSSNLTETFFLSKINTTVHLKQFEGKTLKIKPKLPHTDFTQTASTISFTHQENKFNDFSRESLMPFKVSTEGPAVCIGDVDKNGLEDVFFGGARNQPSELWLQQSNGTFQKSEQPVFQEDQILELVDAQFFDANGDGHLDLYTAVAGNEFFGQMANQQDVLYLNDGKGNFALRSNGLPKMLTQSSCVRPNDFDNDGDIDLFVGGRVVANSYGTAPNSYLLQNDGKGNFTDVTAKMAKNIRNIGMVTDAVWYDADFDGYSDLVLAGDWMPVYYFTNQDGKEFSKQPKQLAPAGLWKTLYVTDFDQDGDSDILCGNLGTNTKFFREGQQHLRMYLNDFDANGQIEQIVSYKEREHWYPVEGRSQLGNPLPGIIKKRFATHKEFASKRIDEIFTDNELEATTVLEVNLLESVVLENHNGSFKLGNLPPEANFAPIANFSVVPNTANGNNLILAVGNFEGVNTWQNKYDASYGSVFSVSSNTIETRYDTGFLVHGEAKKIVHVHIGGIPHVLVARNNDTPLLFKVN